MQRAFLCRTSLIQRQKSLGEWLLTLQQGRNSSKSTLFFLSSPTGCVLCRCEGTKHTGSCLQALVPFLLSQALHVFGSPQPKQGLLPFTSSPSWVMANPQLAQGIAPSCHLSPWLSGNRELSTLPAQPAAGLVIQAGSSQSCCLPNSSFSLHNPACNCSCPEV